MEIQQPVTISEQNRLVDDWYDRRPVKPAKVKVVYKGWNIHFWLAISLSKENGWPEYEQEMGAWRLEVRTFFKWWPSNDHVSDVLQKSFKDTHVL